MIIDKVREVWVNSSTFLRFNANKTTPTIDLRNVANRVSPVGTPTLSGDASTAANAVKPTGKKKAKKVKAPKDTSLQDFRVQFGNAVNRLRARTGDRERLYDYPWYLLVGEEETGKSALMASSSLERWHRDEELTKPGEQLCGWWSSESAIVLDVSGSMVIGQAAKKQDAAWRLLMGMLQKYRYRRPIDGVIVTIPATDLIGPDKLSNEEIAKKGAALHQRLKDIEERLGMCVPIYPIVTKCDIVPGFSSFCAWLPQSRRDDIFGWSNPYTIETAYTGEWIDEAFRELWTTLSPVQMDMLAELPHGADGDGLFQFPSELHTLRAGVREYVDALLRPGAHTHVALMLRGLFFTGDGNVTSMQTGPVSAAQEIISGEEMFAIEPIAAAGEPITFSADATVPDAPSVGPSVRGVKPIFVKELFDRKVLAEYAVAYPFTSNLLSKNRLILAIQIACALIILGSAVGMPLETGRLSDNSRAVLRDLRTVDDNLAQVRAGAGDVTDAQYVEYAQNLLDGIARIENTSLRSWAYPSSWFSPLHGEIRASMVVAFDSVILKAMNAQLHAKADSLPVEWFRADPIDSASAPLAIEATPEFLQLRNYTDDLKRLERLAIMYNRLRVDEQIENVDTLVRGLFGRNLPEGFIKKASYSSRILSDVSPEHFDFDVHRTRATATARHLLTRLNERLFTYNPLLLAVRRIIGSVETLASQQGRGGFKSVEMMFDIGVTIDAAKAAMQQRTLDWMGQDAFAPTGELARLLRDIENSRFIESGVAKSFVEEARGRFDQLRFDLKGESSDVIGTVVQISKAKKNALRFTPTVDSLHAAIVQLGRQKFMQTRSEESVRTLGAPGKAVFWSAGALDEAKKLPELFRAYSGEVMTKFPRGLQMAAQNVALAGLETSMAAFVNRAQRVEGSGGTLEDVRRQTQNLKAASTQFIDLLQFYDSYSLTSGSSLRRALEQQGSSALSLVDKLLRDDQMYSLSIPTAWRGEIGLGDLAFGDPGTLAAQLGAWKEKLKEYTTEYAEPLISFLNSVDANVQSSAIENWRNIVTEVNGGGASIKALENVFLGLNELTIYNYQHKLPDPKNLESRTLLRALRRNVVVELWNHAGALLSLRASQSYLALRDEFNEVQAPYYPWRANIDEDASMVTEDQARAFARKYNAERAKFWRVWSGYPDTDTLGSNRRDYLTQRFDGVAPFMAALFGGPETEPAGVDLLVSFDDFGQRPNGRLQSFPDYKHIADWTLRIGNQVVTLRDYAVARRPMKMHWNFTDDIVFSVRFASGGYAKPGGVEFPQGNKPVKGRVLNDPDTRTVTVEYLGPWALVQLLRKPEYLKNDRRHLAVFRIPLEKVNPSDIGWDSDDDEREDGSVDPQTSVAPSMKIYLGVSILGSGTERIQLPPLPDGNWPK